MGRRWELSIAWGTRGRVYGTSLHYRSRLVHWPHVLIGFLLRGTWLNFSITQPLIKMRKQMTSRRKLPSLSHLQSLAFRSPFVRHGDVGDQPNLTLMAWESISPSHIHSRSRRRNHSRMGNHLLHSVDDGSSGGGVYGGSSTRLVEPV